MKIGQKIIRLNTVDSTNNYTANLLKIGKIEHGTVILADEQTSGKGQRGASWHSKAGENLLLSVFVVPDNLSVDQQVVLTHFASVCMVEILRKIGLSAKIKWPNDIYINDHKIAGILIENTISAGKISNSIIGIGMNVNQMDFDDIIATSIKKEKGEYYPIESVVLFLIDELNRNWDNAKFPENENLKNQYLENLYLKNIEACFEDVEGQFFGEINGISDEGLLLVTKKGSANPVKYDLKELKFISRNRL